MKSQRRATLQEIKAARHRLDGLALRTPLIRLNLADTDPDYKSGTEIYLKLENLQPTGAFKIRCQGNVITSARAEDLSHGVFTGSSGSSGMAMAYVARQLGLTARVYAPEDAPLNKVAAIRDQGAAVHMLPTDDWWNIIQTGSYPGEKGFYANAVNCPDAIAGNGTIGVEIFEDLPEVDTVIVPFGGGGVSSGIASAFHALKPSVKIFGAESTAAMPLAAAFKTGGPVVVPRSSCFISGMGVDTILPDMWPLVQSLLTGAVAAELSDVAHAIKLMFVRNRIVAEGAGAVALAAALSGKAGSGKIVCVVTGGNLNSVDMVDILRGRIPQ